MDVPVITVIVLVDGEEVLHRDLPADRVGREISQITTKIRTTAQSIMLAHSQAEGNYMGPRLWAQYMPFGAQGVRARVANTLFALLFRKVPKAVFRCIHCKTFKGECRCSQNGRFYNGVWTYYADEGNSRSIVDHWVVDMHSALTLLPEDLTEVGESSRRTLLEFIANYRRAHPLNNEESCAEPEPAESP